jgi:hypothetical protein
VTRQTTTRSHGCRIVSRGSDPGRQPSPHSRTGTLLTAGASPPQRAALGAAGAGPTLAQPGGALDLWTVRWGQEGATSNVVYTRRAMPSDARAPMALPEGT